jgi:ribosomal protein L37E
MLICNNCGCVHNQHVTICSQCRIPGDFTIGESELAIPITEAVTCVNCGNSIGADLLRCPECRFPQSKPVRQTHTVKDHGLSIRSLKAG